MTGRFGSVERMVHVDHARQHECVIHLWIVTAQFHHEGKQPLFPGAEIYFCVNYQYNERRITVVPYP